MTTEERLEKLEQKLSRVRRRNRWLFGTVILCLGIGLAFCAFRPAAVQRDILANQFILVDAYGKLRASLTVRAEGPMLALYDEKGDLRAGLAVDAEGPGLALLDEKGEGRASLAVRAEEPALALYDEKGTVRCSIGATATNHADGRTTTYPESSIHLFGPDGKGLWSAPQ